MKRMGVKKLEIKCNVAIFTMKEEERKDVRKLKERKLQVLLEDNHFFPSFRISQEEYVRETVRKKVSKILGTTDFYVEQLYTWADPKYYTKEQNVIVTYLVVANYHKIQKLEEKYKLYTVTLQEIKKTQIEKLQEVSLWHPEDKICYQILTRRVQKESNVDYVHSLLGKANIEELEIVIIHTALKRMRNRIENTNLAFNFLNREFTLSELQQVYEVILDKKLIKANFRKKMEPMVKKTDTIIKESAYRPAQKYEFNPEYIEFWV